MSVNDASATVPVGPLLELTEEWATFLRVLARQNPGDNEINKLCHEWKIATMTGCLNDLLRVLRERDTLNPTIKETP